LFYCVVVDIFGGGMTVRFYALKYGYIYFSRSYTKSTFCSFVISSIFCKLN